MDTDLTETDGSNLTKESGVLARRFSPFLGWIRQCRSDPCPLLMLFSVLGGRRRATRRRMFVGQHLRRVVLRVELRRLEHGHAESRPRDANQEAGENVGRIVHAEIDAA